MKFNFSIFLFVLLLIVSCKASVSSEAEADANDSKHDQAAPNVIVFYVDDLGYGDLSSYGATEVHTPNVDKLAAEGLRFTNAHSPAATCTPSRYSLLTGEFAFRNNAMVLPGDAPLLIDPQKMTMADMFQKSGYKTAVIGKWHLGLGDGKADWNGVVKPGPLELGFDYSFLMPSTGDRVPSVYLENHTVVGLQEKDSISLSYKKKVGDRPTGIESPELLRYAADKQHSGTIVNGVSRIGYMSGGESALWKDEDFPDVFTNKAIEFIEKNKEEPFMLFFSFHDIHVPRLPNERFEGKTSMGPRGDAIVQMDWMTGRIMDALKDYGADKNTLVIFTSDNGAVLNDGYEDFAVEKLGNHNPFGPFRGGKYSAYEAGTRVPFIVWWPEKIQPDTSDAAFSQIDLYASFAHLLDYDLSTNEAPDSKNLMPALLGKDKKGSVALLEESITLSVLKDNWKYIAPIENGKNIPNFMEAKGISGGGMRKPQLFDLSDDIGEENNLAEEFPGVVSELQNVLDSLINN